MSLNIYVLIVSAMMAAVARGQNDTNSEVSTPPSLTAFSGKLVYYRPLSATTLLKCEAVGTPNPMFSWQKNGATFDYSTKPNIKLQTQGTLIFTNPTDADAGNYQCFVSNKWGTTATDITVLQMAMTSLFPQAAIIERTVPQGSSVRLACNPPASVPAASYAWLVAKGAQDNQPRSVVLDNRVQVDQQTGDLFFAYTVPADTKNAPYVYRCQSYNPFLAITSSGSDTHLMVNNVGTLVNTAPKFLFATSSPVTALIGGSIDLVCFFSGYPAPTLTWKKQGGSLPTDRNTFVDFTTLRISDVQAEDAGTYECSAVNSVSSATTTVELRVEAAPMFLNSSVPWPQSVNATTGDTVSITCNTFGIPTPTITWMSNMEKLNPFGLPGKFSLSSDSKVLTISGVCKSCPGGGTDLQTIQCNSSNNNGYLYSTSYLNVFDPTEIISPPQNQALEAGVPTVLNCQSSHDPGTPVTITWYYNDEPFVGVPNKVYVESNGNLYFNTPQLPNGGSSYAGNYTCVVTNGYSTDTASALIGPVIALRQSSVADYWWVFVIVVVLLLILIAIFAVFKYVRENRGDSYPVDIKERDTGNDPERELLDYAFQDYHRAADTGPLIQKTPGPGVNTLTLSSDDSMSQYNNDTYRLYK